MTEHEIRNKVVSTATGYVGCKESDGSHRKIIDIYNGHKPLARGYKVRYDDAWCAVFVSTVSILNGLTDIMPTECGCGKMIDLYKAKGRWNESDAYKPEPGDVIMYDWEDTGKGDNTGSPNHVGIVVSVSGNTIKVVEGNISNSVGYRTIEVNGKYIRGYCLPDYASKATNDNTEPRKTIDELANEVIHGKWGHNPERRERLTAAGYDYRAVQDRVNEILSGKTAEPRKTIDELAREVIRGEWGHNPERKKRLTEAGYDYRAVQDRVNELLKS